jgi:ZIP family zinc transporter
LSQGTTIVLGAISGFAIFIGLPVCRMRWVSPGTKSLLNSAANGILIFLLWDVLSKANEPVVKAMADVPRGRPAGFLILVALFAGGLAVGLLSLAAFNHRLGLRLRAPQLQPGAGPGAELAAGSAVRVATTGRSLAMMIAIGLGLHNLSEGLAIGQSAASGAITFATVLVIGFALHNITEGFGIAAPMATDPEPPSWAFLGLAGLVGGGPTLLGTIIGYSFTSTYAFVLFLTLAAGALIYVIGEMFGVSRRAGRPAAVAAGLLLGFIAGYSTDLLLTYVGG